MLSDIMDLRHQSSAMCVIMLGGEDTHLWSATKGGLDKKQPTTRNNQQLTHTSHYPSRPVETSFKYAAMIYRFTKNDYI